MNRTRGRFRRFAAQAVPPVLAALAWVCAAAPSSAQLLKRRGGGAEENSASTNAPARLPATAEETDRELQQLETRQAEVRGQAAAAAPEATPEELTERDGLLQQWAVALDLQSRNLRRWQEIRLLNSGRAAEAQAWRGFTEPPPYSLTLVEEIRDAVAAAQLEVQADQMLLAISEARIARGSALLEESRRQERLARDRVDSATGPDPRRQWMLRLAETRTRSNEAMLEASAKERLVTLERLAGLRDHLAFLERKLAAARAQARFAAADLDAVLARLKEKREEIRKELGDAVAADAAQRAALTAAREELRRGQADPSAAPPGRIEDLGAVVEAREAQSETSEIKVDLLRGLFLLLDYSETVWRDRFWATGGRSLSELESKRQSHLRSLESLSPMGKLAEMKLSTASAQILAQSIRASSTNLTSLRRVSAGQIETTLEERARLYQRALNAIMMVRGAHDRLMADLAERTSGRPEARGRLALDRIGSFLRRIWNTELYVAEDSVIADGQRISVPRTITLGKVAIALAIFLAGVLVARWGLGVVKRTTSRWFRAGERTAGVLAQFVAGLVVIVALIVAMTSVRIPWTVFAFLGGALAIGVGFGAQTLINNFISGVILLFERSVRVGDTVEVGDQRGQVVNVGFRSSLVRRADGIDVLVPNSKFLETEVVNWTLTDDLVRYQIVVGVAYGSPPQTVSELIRRAATEHPAVVQQPAPQVLLDDFGDSALVFKLRFWMAVQPRADSEVTRSELRYRIHALFDEAGIVLAYPQRDVHLDTVRPLEVRVVPHPSPPGPAARD